MGVLSALNQKRSWSGDEKGARGCRAPLPRFILGSHVEDPNKQNNGTVHTTDIPQSVCTDCRGAREERVQDCMCGSSSHCEWFLSSGVFLPECCL